MPTYTAPTTRTTGELISAAIFNTDLVENLKYFKDAPAFAANVTVGGTLGVTGATTLSSGTYSTFLKSTTALATPSALTATQATAFASTVSGAVIMGFGTTNDVALMNRAGTVVLGIGPNTTTVNMTGLLTVSGFGTHSFSASGTGANELLVRSQSVGTGNYAVVTVSGETAYATEVQLRAHSSTFTTSGPNYAGGGSLIVDTVNGLSIAASHASGVIRFYSGGTTLSGGFPSPNMFFVGTSATYPTGTTNTVYIDNVSNVNTAFSHTTTTNQGWINFLNSNGVIGSITGSGSTTAYNTSSDRRLKNDIGLALNLSALQSVVIHDFTWKVDGTAARGVFAQDAFLVFPSAVSAGTDDLDVRGNFKQPWSVDYSKFVPDLIVGWQQHDATIQQLEARIRQLEGRQ